MWAFEFGVVEALALTSAMLYRFVDGVTSKAGTKKTSPDVYHLAKWRIIL